MHRSIRTTALIAAGFAAGIAFVVACEREGSEDGRGDPSRRDAAVAGDRRDARASDDARASHDAHAGDLGVAAGRDARAGVRPEEPAPCERWAVVRFADNSLLVEKSSAGGVNGYRFPEGWEPMGYADGYYGARRCVAR